MTEQRYRVQANRDPEESLVCFAGQMRDNSIFKGLFEPVVGIHVGRKTQSVACDAGHELGIKNGHLGEDGCERVDSRKEA